VQCYITHQEKLNRPMCPQKSRMYPTMYHFWGVCNENGTREFALTHLLSRAVARRAADASCFLRCIAWRRLSTNTNDLTFVATFAACSLLNERAATSSIFDNLIIFHLILFITIHQMRMLQCVAVCCSELQCVAVWILFIIMNQMRMCVALRRGMRLPRHLFVCVSRV